jgi:hypothetical protein
MTQLGTPQADSVYAVAADGQGGVYIGGGTYGSFGAPNTGGDDAWVARLDASGGMLWVRQFGATTYDPLNGLAADGAGGVFACGETYGTVAEPNQGADDAWVCRYDPTGTRLWIHQFGSEREDFAYAITSDQGGHVFVGGVTSGSVVGGASAGMEDAWLARFDPSGNPVWIRQVGSAETDYLNSMASDSAGGVIVVGETRGDLGGPNLGGFDTWLARIDESSTTVWLRHLGSAGDDACYGVAADPGTGVFIGGATSGTLAGASAGSTDAWLARFGVECFANCDRSTTAPALNIADFACFLNAFAAGAAYANCDESTIPPILNIQDFACFLNRFAAGCS